MNLPPDISWIREHGVFHSCPGSPGCKEKIPTEYTCERTRTWGRRFGVDDRPTIVPPELRCSTVLCTLSTLDPRTQWCTFSYRPRRSLTLKRVLLWNLVTGSSICVTLHVRPELRVRRTGVSDTSPVRQFDERKPNTGHSPYVLVLVYVVSTRVYRHPRVPGDTPVLWNISTFF